MTTRHKASTPTKDLRADAEKLLAKMPRDVANLPVEDMRKLVHELQVHLVELELQNEELRRTQLEMSNVTGNKQAQAALCENEAEFRQVFECSRDAIAISKKGVHVFANPPYLKLFGFESSEQLAGSLILDVIAPSHRDQMRRNIARRAAGEVMPTFYESRGLRAGGQEFDLEVQVAIYESQGDTYTLATVRDITERKQANEELRVSEEKFRQLAETITDVFWIASPDLQKVLYVSPGYERIWGRTMESLYANSHQWLEAVLAEDRERVAAVFTALSGKEPAVSIEYRIVQPDGSLRWVQDRGFQVRDATGKLIRLTGIAQDITARKHAERALAESQSLKRAIIDSTTDLIWSVDTAGFRIQTFNRSLHEYFLTKHAIHLEVGLRPEDLFQSHTTDFVERWKALYQRALDSGSFTTEYATYSGDTTLLLTFCPLTHEAEIFGVSVFGQDITERKRAEAQLRQSEEQYRKLFEQMMGGCIVLEVLCDAEGKPVDHRLVHANSGFDGMTGLKQSEEVGRTSAQLSFKWPPEVASRYYQIALHGGDLQWERFNESLQRWYDIRAFSPMKGQFALVFYDITGRKLAEQKLRESQERYVLAEKATQDGLWDWNLLTGEEYFSPRWKEIVGVQNDELFSHKSAFLNRIHPDDLPRVSEAIREHLETGSRYAIELRLRHQDGSYRWVFARGEAVRDTAGRPLRMVGSTTDITDRKQSEEALAVSEERFRKLFEAAPVGIALLGQQREIVLTNQSYRDFLGYSEAEIMERGPVGLLHPDDWEPSLALSARLRAGEIPLFHKEQRYLRKDGTVVWSDTHITALRDANGRVIHTIGWVLDITERKRAELAARESKEKITKFFMSTPAIVCVSRLDDGRMLDINLEFERKLEHSRDETIGRTSAEMGLWVDLRDRQTIVHAIQETGQIRDFELYLRSKNGAIFSYRYFGDSITIDNVPCLLSAFVDITQQKQAEAALRESEEKYRSIFANAPVGIFQSTTERILFVNPAMAAIFGYASPAEMLAGNPHPSSFFVHPEQRSQMLREALSSGTYVSQEVQERRKDGSSFTSATHLRVICDDDGNLKFVEGFVQDITERLAAARALESERNLLRTLIDHIPGGVYVRDTANRFVLANEVQARNLGVASPADLLGKTDADFFSGEQAARFAADDQGVFAGQALLNLEQPTCHPTGKQCVMLVSKVPLRDANGTVVGLIGIANDITERKRMEESHARLATAIEQAAESVVITDTKGTILYANPAFEKTSGYTRDEALGQNPRVLKSGKHDAEFYREMWAMLVRGKVWSGHLINRRKDGSLFEEEATISPIRDAAGAIINYVAVKRDVTHEVQLESQIRQSQKMEAIGTLAGGIAHDFNNMLAAIFGYAHLLQQDTEGNSLAQESVGEILKSANRAKDLVQQILTFSRQRESSRQIIRLDSIIKEAMKFLRASLPANLKIEMQVESAAPAVLADATQIYQVTMNLATNALHAMEGRNGQLTVTLEPFQPDDAFLLAHPQLRPVPYARLTIADTGHGMDAKTLERIYEPFFTTKPVGKGTGLGLSVVHGIMKSHEGVITVESQVGQGTTFHLYFPAQIQAETATTAAETVRHTHGDGQSILLLDDEVALTSMLQKTLRRLDYQVTASNSGGEAIRLVRTNPAQFDLVITDLTMPEMNGLEVARQLHALRPELPIILMSGHSVSADTDSRREAGICGSLQKPVSLSALAEVVQRVLKKS